MMDRFASSGFQPVEVEGRLVHPMLRLPVRSGDRVELSWVSASSPRVQGVGMRLRRPGITGAKGYGGTLRAHGSESPALLLWIDTTPAIVTVEVAKADDDAELQLSNRWRTDDGVEHEWLNNFGMLIEPHGDGSYTVRCSDGVGSTLNVAFDDLVFKLRLRR